MPAGAFSLSREVTKPLGLDMRVDFVLTPRGAEADGAEADGADTAGEGAMTLVEVKHVIDTDYDPEGERAKAAAAAAAASPTKGKAKGGRAPPLFLGPAGARPYARAAIFPWGRSAQTGPDGEPVVSSRAI